MTRWKMGSNPPPNAAQPVPLPALPVGATLACPEPADKCRPLIPQPQITAATSGSSQKTPANTTPPDPQAPPQNRSPSSPANPPSHKANTPAHHCRESLYLVRPPKQPTASKPESPATPKSSPPHSSR